MFKIFVEFVAPLLWTLPISSVVVTVGSDCDHLVVLATMTCGGCYFGFLNWSLGVNVARGQSEDHVSL